MADHIYGLSAVSANETQSPIENEIVLCNDEAFTNPFAYLLVFFSMSFSHALYFSASLFFALHSRITTLNSKKLDLLPFLSGTSVEGFRNFSECNRPTKQEPHHTKLCNHIHSLNEILSLAASSDMCKIQTTYFGPWHILPEQVLYNVKKFSNECAACTCRWPTTFHTHID